MPAPKPVRLVRATPTWELGGQVSAGELALSKRVSWAGVHLVAAVVSPIRPGGTSTWISLTLPSSTTWPDLPAARLRLMLAVTAYGCEPAWVSVEPSRFVAEPSK